MRRYDKAKHIRKVNILLEERARLLKEFGEVDGGLEMESEFTYGGDDESMDFLRTVKSNTPELYNQYINHVKRKGLDSAKSAYHQHTDQGKKELRQGELQTNRDFDKQGRLSNETNSISDILSKVSQQEMVDYMKEYRANISSRTFKENKRFPPDSKVNGSPSLTMLTSAYVKANNLNPELLSSPSIAWKRNENDELTIFDDFVDSIKSNRFIKLFDKAFNNKFGKIVSDFI